MLLHIASDAQPIYAQIVEQIRYRIISGQLNPGDELPAIRSLAETLKVNPNTVARAYRELEQEGLVEKRRTTGTFVADLSLSNSVAERRRLLRPLLDKLIIQSRQLGFTLEETSEQLRKRDSQISGSSNRSGQTSKARQEQRS